MSAMPLIQALLLLASVVALVVATQRRHVHAFLAIVVVAAAFGLAAGFSTSFVGKAFGAGFSQAIYSPGLAIVAAGFVAGIAESTTAADWLAKIGRRRWPGSTSVAALFGLIAGIGSSPATAFALLTPLLRVMGAASPPRREATTIAPALALSASHGLVLFSPMPIAAASILDAQWGRVALFGLPLALLLAAFAVAWAAWLPRVDVSPASMTESHAVLDKRSGRSAFVLVAATAVPLLMLIAQSLGDIPSEPLGGGSHRELVLGLGRPLILFLVALGIMVVGLWRLSATLLTDSTWSGRIIGNVSGVLLIVGAAGGLQRLCQETGMAELISERLLGWHAGGFAGLLVPFLIAALIKTLQGSSLVAAITAAGMAQPLLAPLALGGANGKALAALAVGAGAMTVAHVNDEYFWLVTTSARLTPLRGLRALTIGTLLQGLIALAALLVLSMLAAGN